MSKVAYDPGRRCDNCGAKSPPFWPRKRSGDQLLCDTCFGKEASKAYYGRFDFSALTDEELIAEDAEYFAEEQSGRVTGDVYEAWWAIQEEMKDRGLAVSQSLASRKKLAHDSPGTDILRHCPFCGAGQLTGRSDGTAECGFCDAAFTVQTQPNLPSTPQTVNDELYMHPEMSEPGVPEEELDPEAEDPVETELPLTPEESGREEGDSPFDDIEKMTFKVGTTTLSPSEYIKHLALKHADNRMAVLREVRASHK